MKGVYEPDMLFIGGAEALQNNCNKKIDRQKLDDHDEESKVDETYV